RFQLPPQRKDFIKRREDITAVTTKLTKDKITQIKGFGGTGKTQLAMGIVYDKEIEYDDIIWIDAEVNISAQVSALMQAVFGIEEETPIDEMVEVLYDEKRITKRVLWVFDNVKQKEDIKLYRPPKGYTGIAHILLTSRVGIIASCYELTGFSETEGRTYIEQQLGKALLPADEQVAKAAMLTLLETVSYLPLALAHAVAYIKQPENKCSIDDYPKYFKQTQIKSFSNKQGDKSLETVRTSVSLSFVALKGHHPIAWQILQSCVGLPARAVPVKFLVENQVWLRSLEKENSELQEQEKKELKQAQVQAEISLAGSDTVHRHVNLLARYSLLSVNKDTAGADSIFFHRLVLQVLEQSLLKSKDEEVRQRAQRQLRRWAQQLIGLYTEQGVRLAKEQTKLGDYRHIASQVYVEPESSWSGEERQLLKQRCDSFLTHDKQRVMVLLGDPGAGKTTFAKRYLAMCWQRYLAHAAGRAETTQDISNALTGAGSVPLPLFIRLNQTLQD
ncbi:MAG: NB-ARC domain-containing protein, partial [Gammaproteobacteria bacterium]